MGLILSVQTKPNWFGDSFIKTYSMKQGVFFIRYEKVTNDECCCCGGASRSK